MFSFKMEKKHLSLPFLSVLSFVSLIGHSLGIAVSSSFSFEHSWPSYNQTQGTLDNPSSALSAFPKNDSALSIKGASSFFSFYKPTWAGGSVRRTRNPTPYLLRKRVALWLLLFVGAGILSFNIFKLPATFSPAIVKTEEEQEEKKKKEKEKKWEPFIKFVPAPITKLMRLPSRAPVEPLTRKTKISPREQLEKVRSLLPVAMLLATTVDTPEAAGIFSSLEECLEGRTQRVSDEEFAEASLITAVKALQQLHQVALEQAKLLSVKDEAPLIIPKVSKWVGELKNAKSILGCPRVRQAVEPFCETIESLQGNIEVLTKIMEETGERMKSQRKFMSEDDGELLLAAAADLQQLRISGSSRKRFFKLAAHAHACTVDTVKAMVVRDREVYMWDLDEQLGELCVKAALARSVLEGEGGETSSPSFTGDSSTRDARINLNNLQEDLASVLVIAQELHSLVITMQTAESLTATELIYSNLVKQQKQAAALVKKAAATAAALPLWAEHSDSSGLQVAAQAALWLEKSYNQDLEGINAAVQQAQNDLSFLQDGINIGIWCFKNDLVKEQRREVEAIKETSLKRKEVISSTLRQLKESRSLSEILPILRATVINLKEQTKDRETLEVITQKVSFMWLLQNNLLHLEADARRIAKHRNEFKKATEGRHYEELERQHTEAILAVKEAKTLEEAVDAAGYLRAVAVQMHDLFTSKNA